MTGEVNLKNLQLETTWDYGSKSRCLWPEHTKEPVWEGFSCLNRKF